MNDTETLTFENKNYVSPTVSRDEQMSFVDTLRQTSAENVDRINRDTQALGSQVDPMYGGFSKGTQFADRYVTPQTNALVDTLKATAQQTALNQALSNLQEQYTQRYNDAYRNAKIREYDEYQAEKAAANSSSTTTANDNNTQGDVEINYNTGETVSGYNSSIPNKYTVVDSAGILHIVDMTTGEEETVDTKTASNSLTNKINSAVKNKVGL